MVNIGIQFFKQQLIRLCMYVIDVNLQIYLELRCLNELNLKEKVKATTVYNDDYNGPDDAGIESRNFITLLYHYDTMRVFKPEIIHFKKHKTSTNKKSVLV